MRMSYCMYLAAAVLLYREGMVIECFCFKAHAFCKYDGVLLQQGVCLLQLKWNAFATKRMPSATKVQCF